MEKTKNRCPVFRNLSFLQDAVLFSGQLLEQTGKERFRKILGGADCQVMLLQQGVKAGPGKT